LTPQDFRAYPQPHEILERQKCDYNFRYQPNRTKHYYVKNTRKRTIITVYGEVTYTRTEYIDRLTSKMFCPVDRKIGLLPRQRYDNTIIFLAYELYSDHNSMIKVGKLIGDLIDSKYSISKNRKFKSIPRQTIRNMLTRIKSINVPLNTSENTPEILYVMADEKYIPSQNNDKKAHMVKAAQIFEDKVLTNQKGRYKLINKHLYLHYENNKDDFWDNVFDIIDTKYEFKKINTIYLMGDGASWIKRGISELKMPNVKIKPVLDGFHFKQAIEHITKDETYKKILYHYSIKNMKDDFKKVIEIIKTENPNRIEIIDEKSKYILNHLKEIRTLYKEVKIGCPMEQVISHSIASIFTSIPKAYGNKNISTYLNIRQHQQNGHDIRNLILQALQHSQNISFEEIDLTKEKYDFSFLKLPKNTYKINCLNHHFDKGI